MQIENVCEHREGGKIKGVMIISRKDNKKLFDPKTTERVRRNIFKRAIYSTLDYNHKKYEGLDV